MYDNKTVVTAAGKVFDKYDLPDGVTSIHSNEDHIEIFYRLGEWDFPEMEQICKALDVWKTESGTQYVAHKTLQFEDVTVKVWAQIPKGAYVGIKV